MFSFLISLKTGFLSPFDKLYFFGIVRGQLSLKVNGTIKMNVLILGKGGRELAIQKAVVSSPLVQKIFVAPGGDGFSNCLPAYPYSKNQAQEIIKSQDIGLVIIGPEKELAKGAGDLFRSLNVPVFGPSKESAQLESSKLFAKHFMLSAGIPTSEFEEVNSVKTALKASTNFGFPLVLKADGLAGGKGVFMCPNKESLKQKAKSLFEEKTFGSAGERALVEKFQTGWELSLFILITPRVGGESQTDRQGHCPFLLLPFAKDYKKLKDNNQGPNTGGMGALAPYFISPELKHRIEKTVVLPSVQAIQQHNFFYRGVLYIGLMIVNNKDPIVLEYNVRFGDPETQVLLPLLDGDWAKVFLSIAKGHLPTLKWKKDMFSACVVLANKGYPEKSSPPALIEGNLDPISSYSYFLPAGVQKKRAGWFTKGGRVLNAMGLGNNKQLAIRRAYEQARQAHWPGMQKRSDIGS